MNKPKLSKSGVSWTDYSWGVVDGCTKVSAACQNCYAEAMVTRFQPDRKFSDVICHPERLEAPLNTKKGGKVFVAPLGDLFHPDVPDQFIIDAFIIMFYAKQHTFQVLTKRPERMLEMVKKALMKLNQEKNGVFNPIKNVWLGVTAENQEQADKRILILLQIPAAVRFVSIEPMLGQVEFKHLICARTIKDDNGVVVDYMRAYDDFLTRFNLYDERIDWVICGGESGKNARPMHPEWVRSLRDQCVAAGVPFYFKQWGEWLPFWNGTHLIYKDGKFINGGHENPDCWKHDLAECILKVGTKRAGCLLDGKEWKQFPEVGI